MKWRGWRRFRFFDGQDNRFHGDQTRDAVAASGERAPAGLARIRSQDARGKTSRPGSALHGLRDPLLPQGLPARQHYSRLERSGLSRTLARSYRSATFDQQFSRIHRTRVSGAVRRGLRPQHQQRPGYHQADRKKHYRSRVVGGLDHCRSPHRARPESAWLWSARDRRASRARNNSRAPATRSRSTSDRIGSAVC